MALQFNHDDEFDWEAAVAEIDVACRRVALDGPFLTSANCIDIDCSQVSLDRTLKQSIKGNTGILPQKPSKAVRQSTLDKFVEITEKHTDDQRSYYENRTSNCENSDALFTIEGIKSDIDPAAAKTWIYPINVPLRDYQFSIVKTALFSNTLVSLPTGLGKTLIAAVVMYNYFRWFPTGKIVFAAPSRPLVIQQIEACHNIVGIPQEWTIDMTGQMSPAQRSGFWQSKRIFFVTPQVLEKDIQSGACLTNKLVCLVIDEAHRAMGNYSYCVVVREIMAMPVQLRILALTATPGTKQATIQTVIDNLHISTMEYRNENDPDVSQYTHNRKLELIQVAINKESLKVSSLLLEVIQPIVQRLCNLGVFYNKDIARLTPFEFLTARERFRQAPPSTLAQMQYGEVEGYFGAAITLYHIYKLLFSHGVRPAFEMLQQKMQQGSFARLMGRNETMWQVKLLMQQTLGHGAPNPKLLKMEEIIIKHFESTDHKNSRVIIFTNFRESVKDIMESLAKLGDAIKAMEFIGQTSGKASKGQSQKVQQAVLKKFRAGGYNIIVATSIGEEGLDIMEVDLVICFDANISPLRMIQRMGRTGRKRDGRVVILASEGSELQGYLKKQAKGRAVGKHMHNGGINSFNFHSSPRMVPHSFQPEVQFVEMSIEKFVPRGRKPKVDAASADLGADDLTDCENNLLGKYFGLCTDKNWKPSLIAFPHYQLFPSPVYKVKHSFRTTEMLIDTLQCLQEPRISLMGSKTCSLIKEVEGSSTYCMPALLDITKETTPQGISTKAGSSGPLDLVPEQHDSEPCSPSTPLDEAIPDSPKYSGEINAFSTGFSNQVDAFAKHKSPFNEELLEKNSDADIHYQETEPEVSSSSRISLHRCLFNTGFVSVGPDGKVIISAAPTLPLLNEPSSDANFVIRSHSAELFSEGPVLPSLKIDYPEKAEVSMPRSDPIKMTLSPEVIKVSTSPSGLMEVMFSPKQVKVSTPPSSLTRLAVSPGQVKDIFCGADEPEVRTPISSSRLFGKPEDVVPATPDSCFVNFPSDVPENVSPHTSDAGASYIDFSPRLRNLAERGIVPESPIATVTKCAIAEREPKNQYASNLMANGTRSHQKSPAFGIVASSWEEPHTYLREKGIADVANTNTEICKTPRENEFTAPADVSQEVLKENNMKLKDSSPFSEAGPQNLAARRSLQDDAKKLNFEFLSVSKSLAVKATSTPANNLSSKSCSEDWQLSSAEAAKSVQKARKFKRLCKYRDRAKGKFSATPTEIPSKSKTKLDNLSVGICRKSRLLKGRQYSKVSVHPFIDEEAEVSSDEQLSTDEDDDNEDAGDEGESESDSFIDDRIEPTAAPTQAEGHHVDMMAIYRKSLLTQSPLDDELNPWDHFHRSHISPGCTGNESSAASEETFVSEDSLVGTDSRSLAASPRPSAVHDSPIKTSSSGCLGINDVVKDSEIVDLNAGSSEERSSKIESRKRKLSFHQVNAPANLKLLENQVSSLLGGNLKEKLNESCNQNQHIDGTFDDGLFEGLDLDALEAEAAEMVRARPNITLCMQQTIPIVPSCLPYTHTLDMGSSVKPFLNNTTSIQQPTRMPLAEAFDVQNCINDKDNSNDCSTAGGVKEKNQETGIDVDLDFLCTPSFDLGI